MEGGNDPAHTRSVSVFAGPFRLMRFTVLIPTFRRPRDLQRGLEALEAQTRRPDEVIVTVRDIDTETRDFLREFGMERLPIRIVDVTVPGVVAAMNAGLKQATGDLIALTDDDTAPYADWLARIEETFTSDPTVGGVGGRDWQPHERGDEPVVGIVQWFGRVIGNHHLGAGPARPVDILKGANCAYRAAPMKAIGFDDRLLGGGAQVNWELFINLAFRRAGWTLIYDPLIAMDHFPAQRFDDDLNHRGIFTGPQHQQAVHNGTLAVWEHFPTPQKLTYLLWFLLVGTRNEAGLLHFFLRIARRDRQAWPRLKYTMAGRFEAIATSRKTRAEVASRPSPPRPPAATLSGAPAAAPAKVG